MAGAMGYRLFRVLLRAALLPLALPGCASVSETHYFATVESGSQDTEPELVNVFRLRVGAWVGASNARYLAGNFDERAVDFFLNEVKSEDYVPSEGKGYGPAAIFSTCSAGSDSQCADRSSRLVSLPSGSDENSSYQTFVVILSSNANAIAETIGAFAENDLVIESFSYLLNKDTYTEQNRINAIAPLLETERRALTDTLVGQYETLTVAPVNSSAAEIAVLRTIAMSLDPNSVIDFRDADGAEQWFASYNQ